MLLAIKRIDDYIEQEYSTTEIEKMESNGDNPDEEEGGEEEEEECGFPESFVQSFESILTEFLFVRFLWIIHCLGLFNYKCII